MTDTNHNGISDVGELQPAYALLSRIGLTATLHNRRDGNGNLFGYRGWVELKNTKPSKIISIYDVLSGWNVSRVIASRATV